MSDYGVVGEMQVVVALTIKIDPALRCGALGRSDGHRQRRRTVCRYHYAGRDRDPIVARSDSSGVPDQRHCVTERAWSEFPLRNRKRLVSAGRVV